MLKDEEHQNQSNHGSKNREEIQTDRTKEPVGKNGSEGKIKRIVGIDLAVNGHEMISGVWKKVIFRIQIFRRVVDDESFPACEIHKLDKLVSLVITCKR